MISELIMFIMKMSGKAVILKICLGLVYIGYKANQPMTVPDAPKGMTYFEFMKDRIDVRVPVKSHSLTGLCRTVRTRKILVKVL